IALSRLHIHDRQGEVLRRDHARIAVLAGTARADEAMLRALVALDLGVLERRPIRLLLAEASDIFLHDVLDWNIDQFGRSRMPCNAHGSLLSNGIIGIESIPALRGQSMKRPCACDPERDVTCVPSVRAPRGAWARAEVPAAARRIRSARSPRHWPSRRRRR